MNLTTSLTSSVVHYTLLLYSATVEIFERTARIVRGTCWECRGVGRRRCSLISAGRRAKPFVYILNWDKGGMVTLSDLTDFLEHSLLCSPTFRKPFDARFNGIYLMKRLAADYWRNYSHTTSLRHFIVVSSARRVACHVTRRAVCPESVCKFLQIYIFATNLFNVFVPFWQFPCNQSTGGLIVRVLQTDDFSCYTLQEDTWNKCGSID